MAREAAAPTLSWCRMHFSTVSSTAFGIHPVFGSHTGSGWAESMARTAVGMVCNNTAAEREVSTARARPLARAGNALFHTG